MSTELPRTARARVIWYPSYTWRTRRAPALQMAENRVQAPGKTTLDDSTPASHALTPVRTKTVRFSVFLLARNAALSEIVI